MRRPPDEGKLMRVRGAITMLTAIGVMGCAARQSQVPLVGTAEEFAPLQGDWHGDYWSSETGRTGSISFTLTARGDTARGNVIMIPAGMAQPLSPWSDTLSTPSRTRAEVLKISFVRVSGSEVSGSLDPYEDPTCDCALYTRFAGRLQGDTISGTYISRQSGSGKEAHGSWRVTRKPS
jgi:hypothetical protein